ncbi:ATP-binding protein [Photobacterium sp. 53610]|uniref:ATP-binding protein n=1 Tax=Photobacterium sp. 53610 TaxID=3102789 RepID=UPI002ED7FDFF
MSSDMNAEQASRSAQRALFQRFLLTLLICFIFLNAVMVFILTYLLDYQERKLLSSLGQEYQRILTFESDTKLEHVVINNPNRLIENAISVVRADSSGELEWLSGADRPDLPETVSAYQSMNRRWYHLFSHAPYLSLKLDGKPSQYWLIMDGTPRRTQLFVQGTGLFVALAAMVGLIALIVWRLLSRTLSPLHSLAKGVDQVRGWSLDVMLETDLPELESGGPLGQLSQSVQQVLNRLKETVRGMDQTVDAIAHDVRTPLSRMILTTEAALSRDTAKLQPEQIEASLRSALSDCAESAQQANQMLTTLMRIHDEQVGRHVLETQPIELAQLLSEVAAWYEEVAEDAEIRLDTDGLEAVTFISDAKRLIQIVVNLVDNSMKYSPAGTEVQLACGYDGTGVWFSVTDQGMGIAPEHQALIFRRLYRVEGSRHQPGYGLGLAMVSAMVNTLQGRIELNSVLGEGSRFTIRLPGTMTQTSDR